MRLTQIQSRMHQMFAHIYPKVSIGPPHMENPTGFSQASPPQTAFPHITL